MSEQITVNATEVTPEQIDATAQKPLSFKEYKQKLSNEVDIAELRARIAKAYFEELAASNQYNQLRGALMAQAMEAQKQTETDTSPDENTESTVETQAPVATEVG